MRKRKKAGFEEMCREIEEKSPCVFRLPKMKPEVIKELEQMVEDYRKRIEYEKMSSW